MSKELEATLGTIADGVAEELFRGEHERVLANILDPNTAAGAKRKITLTLTFEPNENRRDVKVTVESKCALAPLRGHSGTIYVGLQRGKPVGLVYDMEQRQFEWDEAARPRAIAPDPGSAAAGA